MKRILIGLLVLGMAAGSVFAQDAPALTFSGDFKGGLTFIAKEGIDAEGDKTTDTFMNAWNDDGGLYGKLTAKYDGGNWGTELGMKFIAHDPLVLLTYDKEKSGTDALGFANKFYAAPDGIILWGGWLENKVKATIGMTGSDWGTGGWLDKDTGDSAFRLAVYPMEGLSLGFTLGDRDFLKPEDYRKAETFLQEFGLGVKYKSTLFDVAAGFRNNMWGERASKDQRAYLYATIRPITGLVVELGGMAAMLGEDFSDGGNIDIRFRPRFTIGIVTVGSGVQAALFQAKDSKIGWKIPIYLKADFTSVFAPAYVEIDANVKNNGWDVEAFGNLGGSDKLMTAEVPVKLGYIYSFSSTATVETFYKITPTIFIGDDPSKDPTFKHQITANFKYTF